MLESQENIVIALAAILAFVSFFIVLGLVVRKIKLRRIREIMGDFDQGELLGATDSANIFGIKSAGLRQLKGNGILLLTKDRLQFSYLIPKRTIIIPTTAITAVDTPRSFAGKTIFRPLLKVTWIAENGKNDEAAFYVPDLHNWVDALEALNR